MANHWIKHNWFDLLVQPSTQTWAISLYAMFLYIYHQRVYSLWQTKLTTIWWRSQSVKYNACGSKFHGFLVQTDPETLRKLSEIPQLFEGKKLSFVGLVNEQQISRGCFWLWNWKMLISTVLLYSKCILVFPCYHEFKLIFLENHTEFWIRVKKLFEPIVLPRKGDGLLLFLKINFLR